MRVPQKSINITLNLCVLFLGTLVAHVAAGGTFVAPVHLVGNAIFLAFPLVVLSRIRLEGPKLALLILIAQSSGHLILGGIAHSNLTMLLSHLLGGFLSFILISRCEQIWERALGVLFQFLLPLRLRLLSINTNPAHLLPQGRIFGFSTHSTLQFLFRGPPSYRIGNFS